MSITTIANRYGRALVEVALQKSEQKEVLQELQGFVEMMNENADLREVFSNPTISLHQQRSVLDVILKLAKPRQTISNFLHVLLDNYRLQYLPEISQAFNRILDEKLNIVSAEITTAHPVSEAQRKQLADQLRKMTGKEMRLKFSEDPSLIGGAVTQIGSQIYDGSIRNQLDILRSRLSRE